MVTPIATDMLVPPSGLTANFAGTRSNPGLSRAQMRALVAAGRKLDEHDPGVVRETAAQFVSELFFKPMLAEMRRFPFGRELATGGRTEAIFGEQLDERVADNVAAADRGLLTLIVRELEPQVAAAAPGAERATWPAQTGHLDGARGESS